MNYELAKQLKDAGFPLKKLEVEVKREPVIVNRESIYFPTLSELIKACGKDFEQLIYNPINSIWAAGSYPKSKEETIGEGGFGKTPEEAVAKLYIELNKKE